MIALSWATPLAWAVAAAVVALPTPARPVTLRLPAASSSRSPARARRPSAWAGAVAGAGVLVLRPDLLGFVLAVGVGLGTNWLLQRARRASRPTAADDRALTLSVLAAALRAGTPTAAAAAAVAEAAGGVGVGFGRAARLLAWGAPPAEAWADVDLGPGGAAVRALAVRSATSGVALAEALERHAARLRAEVAALAARRAQRVGVLAVLPLAACFLPAFVCLGVVPMLVGLAGQVSQR